jgi:hypothetical protein
MSMEDIIKACLEQQKKEREEKELLEKEETEKKWAKLHEKERLEQKLNAPIVIPKGAVYIGGPRKQIPLKSEDIDIAKQLLDLICLERKSYTFREEEKATLCNTQIRNIGKNLWDNGGEPRMSQIVDIIRILEREQSASANDPSIRGCARQCERDWSGIGTWLD